MNKLQELNQRLANTQEQIKKDGRQALLEIAQEAFVANPDLRIIQWTQTTPTWNDGDPCYHWMNDVYFVTEQVVEDAIEDGEVETIEQLYEENWVVGKYCPYSVSEELTELRKALCQNSKIWEMIFGTNVGISLTPDEIIVFDVEPDY